MNGGQTKLILVVRPGCPRCVNVNKKALMKAFPGLVERNAESADVLGLLAWMELTQAMLPLVIEHGSDRDRAFFRFVEAATGRTKPKDFGPWKRV